MVIVVDLTLVVSLVVKCVLLPLRGLACGEQLESVCLLLGPCLMRFRPLLASLSVCWWSVGRMKLIVLISLLFGLFLKICVPVVLVIMTYASVTA